MVQAAIALFKLNCSVHPCMHGIMNRVGHDRMGHDHENICLRRYDGGVTGGVLAMPEFEKRFFPQVYDQQQSAATK